MAFTLRDSSPWPPPPPGVEFWVLISEMISIFLEPMWSFPERGWQFDKLHKVFAVPHWEWDEIELNYRLQSRTRGFFLSGISPMQICTVTEKKKTRRTCLLHSVNCHTPSAYLLPPTEHRTEQKCNREYLLLLEMGWANNIPCFTFPAAPATILPTRSPNNIRIVGGGAVAATDGHGI